MKRGDAEIVQEIMYRRSSSIAEMLRYMRKIIIDEINSACILFQPLLGHFQYFGVPVEGHDADSRETSPGESSECPPRPACNPPAVPSLRGAEFSTNSNQLPRHHRHVHIVHGMTSSVLCLIRTDSIFRYHKREPKLHLIRYPRSLGEGVHRFPVRPVLVVHLRRPRSRSGR